MRILLTAFDPFGGEPLNPALEAVEQVPEEILGAEIIKLEVPTVFGKGARAVLRAIQEHRPDMVLCVGQAGGRSAISVEFVGINYADARTKDNEGNAPKGEPIREDGENAYFSSLPVKAMVARIRRDGLPAHLSFTAGSFVCNELLYSVLYHQHKQAPWLKAGFIHVPYTPAQAATKADGTPAMSVPDIARALTRAIEAMINPGDEPEESLGRTE